MSKVYTCIYKSYFSISATDARSIEKHTMNTVFTVLNLLVSAKPVRLLHVYHPIIFIFIYGLFSLIYQSVTGDAVYSILDWLGNPGPTIGYILVLFLVALPLGHAILFGLYQLRLIIAKKCCGHYSIKIYENFDNELQDSQMAY